MNCLDGGDMRSVTMITVIVIKGRTAGVSLLPDAL